MEGIGKTVFRNFIAFGKSGLLYIFTVVLKKSVVCLHQKLGVVRLVGCKNVPSGKIGGVINALFVLKLIPLVDKVLLCPSKIFAGSLYLIVLSLHLVSVGCGDEIGGNKVLIESVIIGSPHNGRVGVACKTVDGVSAAPCLKRNENARFKELCFRYGHESISFGKIVNLGGCDIQSRLKISEVIVVDLCGSLGISHIRKRSYHLDRLAVSAIRIFFAAGGIVAGVFACALAAVIVGIGRLRSGRRAVIAAVVILRTAGNA